MVGGANRVGNGGEDPAFQNSWGGGRGATYWGVHALETGFRGGGWPMRVAPGWEIHSVVQRVGRSVGGGEEQEHTVSRVWMGVGVGRGRGSPWVGRGTLCSIQNPGSCR